MTGLFEMYDGDLELEDMDNASWRQWYAQTLKDKYGELSVTAYHDIIGGLLIFETLEVSSDYL